MEQIIKIYGKFLLEGIVLVALLTILFVEITDEAGNKGVWAITGNRIEVESIDYKEYTDFKDTYQSESNKAAPTISVIGTHLCSGLCVIPAYIKAIDYAGNELPVKVSSIKDESGTELINNYNIDTGEIDFVPGIYTVKICAKDANNKQTSCTIQIPVSK